MMILSIGGISSKLRKKDYSIQVSSIRLLYVGTAVHYHRRGQRNNMRRWCLINKSRTNEKDSASFFFQICVLTRGWVGNLSMFLNWAPSIISIYTLDTHFGVTPC